MEMEELPENSDWRAKQRERERERRRIRDRQRRQSMSLDEREKHLARRRRNYQLRRERAAVNTGNGHDRNFTDNHLAPVPVTGHNNVQPNEISSLDHIGAYESQLASDSNLEDNLGAHEHPKRLRTHQIRHLARLLNTDPNTRNSQYGNCESRKRIRLTHVKRLARSLNSTMENSSYGNRNSIVQENQNMLEPPAMQMIANNALQNERLPNTEDN